MKRIFSSTTLVLLTMLTLLSGSLYATDSPNVIGTAAHAKLYDYRFKTCATITVKSVEVTPQGETIIVKLNLKYTNEGSQSYTWYFENVALVDSKGRQYTGMSYFNPYSMKKFRDFIRELQPGMTENTFVYFKVPKLAFGGDVCFCIVSDQDNKPQALIRIFEKKQSKYEFKKSGVFNSLAWNGEKQPRLGLFFIISVFK